MNYFYVSFLNKGGFGDITLETKVKQPKISEIQQILKERGNGHCVIINIISINQEDYDVFTGKKSYGKLECGDESK